jgi:hypothetical protein
MTCVEYQSIPLLLKAELSKLAFEVDRKGLNLNVGSAKRPSFAIK